MEILGRPKTWFTLQLRVFSIPWVKRNPTVLLCLKARNFSHSPTVPVRYIPKKSSSNANEIKNWKPSSTKQLQKPLLHDSFDDDELRTSEENYSLVSGSQPQQVRPSVKNNPTARPFPKLEETNCRLSFADDKTWEEAEERVLQKGIGRGKKNMKKNVQTREAVQDVEKSAVELLAVRAYAAVELRKKLVGKRFPPSLVDNAIADFQSRGLINDSLYAETFSQSRFSSSSWGPLRIKQALFKKGVSETDAENAIKLVFKEGESGDQESSLGLSKLSSDHLLVHASKQWLRGENVPKETRKNRIIRWLQYRGFNWGVISFVLKKLESQYPA